MATHLSIPAIGLDRPLLRLGLNTDGTVEVPSSRQADLPGWYGHGPAPGELGSAVILGHVDSTRGPAVFYELRRLVRGERVDVRLADGRVARFDVRRVRTYANEEFPARRVYGPHGFAGLQLVTCGGAYDPELGYQANLVVYTRLRRILAAPPQHLAGTRTRTGSERTPAKVTIRRQAVGRSYSPIDLGEPTGAV